MATPGEKLAESLEKLKALQDSGIVAIRADDLSRVHKERLIKNGFIKEVIKGWYIATPHDELQGDSTSWFTSFWDFSARYLQDRYGEDYCVSAEQSLMFHAGNNAVPGQLIIRSSKGNNSATNLLFGTSIFVMKSPLPDIAEIEIREGMRIVSLASSIVHSTPSIFTKQAIDSRTALMMIQDASELLPILLEGGHSTIAGRLVGAYRNLGQDKIADAILKTMTAAGYDVRETDPFTAPSTIKFDPRERSPYVNRIKLMWQEMREVVIAVFPKPPGIPEDLKSYMEKIDEIYVTDAYHSLSIEKYNVTPELIERVRSGNWNPEDNVEDLKQKDAMAARGYWLAFNAVKKSIQQIVEGKNPGNVADEEHGDWYRELFGPSITTGILKPSDLAGYRNAQVYIGQSKHTPVNVHGVRDVMPLLFELLASEKEACVRAVLGHFFFVYIHPYMDGNGRMGRFLMNTMLISGGYPWTVIPIEERDVYMKTLESASVENNIEPFAQFIAYLVDAGLKGKPIAKKLI
ncbi:Fic family protein [Arenibacter sp. GZD96]|uniref:Fic family protein n=1 Tax=Aurantibrevibacter litoralis TaxID=3106030 RepID=UPI002AFF0857|nr:Fic family protein [Arenibacter sp. GZD-96]MEA1784690.1 Fic family protein [Arenibacter sp. GZD-96]